MNTKKKSRLCSFIIAAFMITSLVLPSFTSQAGSVCEEWHAKMGLIDKSGNEEDGYTIGSRGDSGVSMARCDLRFDLLATEIQFSFDAYPIDGVAQESFAYIGFGLDLDDKKMLGTAEENAEAGRIEFILWKRADGKLTMSLFNGVEKAVLSIDNFDFEKVHTISFVKRSIMTMLVLDGTPYSSFDFSPYLEKHEGDNAGKTYLTVGGLQAYEFSNLKIVPTEKQEESTQQSTTKKPSNGKLGDIEFEEEDTMVDENNSNDILWLGLITVGSVVIVSGCVACVLLLAKRKKKVTDTETK